MNRHSQPGRGLVAHDGPAGPDVRDAERRDSTEIAQSVRNTESRLRQRKAMKAIHTVSASGPARAGEIVIVDCGLKGRKESDATTKKDGGVGGGTGERGRQGVIWTCENAAPRPATHGEEPHSTGLGVTELSGRASRAISFQIGKLCTRLLSPMDRLLQWASSPIWLLYPFG